MDPATYPATCWAILGFRTTQVPDGPAPSFSDAELSALEPLRRRYEQDGDRFDKRELGHLHFLRWLYETGRLTA